MNPQVQRYFKIFLRWWWLLIVSAIIPAGVSYYFTSQQQDVYQAKATIMVGQGLQDPDPDLWQLNLGNTLAAAYAELVRQGPTVEAVIESLGIDRHPAELANQISTRIYSGAQLLEIQVTDGNPEAAAVIANALATELIRQSPTYGSNDPEQQEFVRKQLEELQNKIEETGQQINELSNSLADLTSAAEIEDARSRITVMEEVKSTYQTRYTEMLNLFRAESPNVLTLFDEATVPQWALPKKTKLIVAIGGVAGLGLAIGAIILIEYLDTSLRIESKEIQTIQNLKVLGMIPVAARKARLPSSNQLSVVAEGIRTMRANVFLARPDQPYSVIQLTSPGPSEGKSFIVANLSVVLASAGNRVIVVDADMRIPSLHEYFDLPNLAGLSDILNTNDADLENIASIHLQETAFTNLRLLASGTPPVDPATLLTSRRFPQLLALLEEEADMILIDSPPTLNVPDASIIATRVECTILVASAGSTRQDLIQKARDQLITLKDVNLLGLIINRAKPNNTNYYYSKERVSKAMTSLGSAGDRTWLTLEEAAAHLGISKHLARQWCKSGRIPAERKRLAWRIEQEAFQNVVDEMATTLSSESARQPNT